MKLQQKIQLQYLPVKNGQLEYVRFGNGDPIIFINGYTADINGWDRRMLLRLAEQHEIILLNNRSIGASHVASSDYTCQNLAEDTHQLIHGLNLKRPAIFGFSMGGMIAQQLAVLYPESIGQLILVNTLFPGREGYLPDADNHEKHLSLPKNPIKRLMISLRLFFPSGYRCRAALSLLFNRFLAPNYPFDNYPSDLILKKQHELIMQWHHNDAVANQITQLRIPTLILAGDADTIVPHVNSETLAHNIKDSKLITLKEGGHAMGFQYPLEIASAVSHFLETIQADY